MLQRERKKIYKSRSYKVLHFTLHLLFTYMSVTSSPPFRLSSASPSSSSLPDRRPVCLVPSFQAHNCHQLAVVDPESWGLLSQGINKDAADVYMLDNELAPHTPLHAATTHQSQISTVRLFRSVAREFLHVALVLSKRRRLGGQSVDLCG